MQHRLSNVEKRQIRVLAEKGWTHKAIAVQINRSVPTITTYLKLIATRDERLVWRREAKKAKEAKEQIKNIDDLPSEAQAILDAVDKLPSNVKPQYTFEPNPKQAVAPAFPELLLVFSEENVRQAILGTINYLYPFMGVGKKHAIANFLIKSFKEEQPCLHNALKSIAGSQPLNL